MRLPSSLRNGRCALLLLAAPVLHAQYLFDSFVEPPWVATGEPDAEFSQWDNFYRANGTNLPDQDAPFGFAQTASSAGVTPPATTSASDPSNPIAYWNNNNPTITQTAGGAFIIGPSGGNVYSFSNPTAFRLNDTVSYALGTVVFQFQTEGNLFDPNSLRLIYNNGGGNVSLAPADLIQEYAVSGSSFGGLLSRAAAQWNLSGLGITSYQIVWNASASSMSFQRALLDTTSVTGVAVPRAGNFTGAGGSNWASTSNWNGGLLPDSAGNVRFTGGAAAALDTSRMVALVTFGTPANFTLSASSGATLTVNSGFTATSARAYTVTAPVQFGGYNLIDVAAGATLDLQGAVSGSSGFQKSGLGTLLLHANNSFGGGITLAGGTLEIFGTNSYGDGTFIGNGTLILHGNDSGGSGTLGAGVAPVALGVADSSDTDAEIWIAGNFTVSRTINLPSGADVKVIGARSTSNTGATYSGTLGLDVNADNVRLATQSATDAVQFSGAIAGGSSGKTLHIVGPGTVVYSGTTKTYASATSVDSGTLRLASGSSFTGAGAFNVASGATLQVNGNLAGSNSLAVAGNLSGNGTIQRATTLSSGAVLSPGASSVGNLTFGSNLALNGLVTYRWDLQNALLAAGTGWDLATVNGTLSIGSTAAQPFVLRLVTCDAGGNAGFTQGFDPSLNYDWTIALGLTGMSSSGFFTIDESEFLNPTPGTFSLNFTAHSIILHYAGVAIPEPAAIAILGGAVAAAVVIFRSQFQRKKS